MTPAVTTTAHQAAPGLFLLAWGLFATTMGVGLVTNFRGFTTKLTQDRYASSAWLRRIQPWRSIPQRPGELDRRARRFRLIGIPFAIIGPIATVAGILQILRGQVSGPRGHALPLPIALVFIGFTVVTLYSVWRPRGPFRLAAREGGRARAAAAVASIGALAFSVFLVFGYTTPAVASWLVGGLASVYALISRRAADTRIDC